MNCTECGNPLWAPRSIAAGICAACHPHGPSVCPNWDALDPDKIKAKP